MNRDFLKMTRFHLVVLIPFFLFTFSCCSFFEKEKETIDVIHQLQDMSELATVEFVVSKVVKMAIFTPA